VGPPAPPVRLQIRTSALAAAQRGATIVLEWPAPPLVADDTNRSYISRAEIYRLVEPRNQEPILDPDDFEEQAETVGVLDRDALDRLAKAGGLFRFTDRIDLADPVQLETVRLRYALRYVNKRGQEAALSNLAAVEPAGIVAAAPAGLRVTDQKQDEIRLEWNAPHTNANGTTPVLLGGYNIYRRLSGRAPPTQPLNDQPLTEPFFVDRRFRYGAEYAYFIRAISPGQRGLIESEDSEPVQLTPEDTYPPAAPEPVTLASANGVISLFWPTSPERDVSGYFIYRSDASDAAEPKPGDTGANTSTSWTKLTPQPITTTTFRDDRVVLGKKYFYRVAAIDRFQNESKPSAVVSETANP
jgi:hypothetical protein